MPRKNTIMDRRRQRKAKNHPTRPNKSGKIYGTPLKLMKVRRPNWMMSFRLILHKYFFHTIIASGVSRNWMITKGIPVRHSFWISWVEDRVFGIKGIPKQSSRIPIQ